MKNFLKDTAVLILGGAIFAAGLCIFASPAGILTGGAGGVAIILNSLTGLPLGTGILLVNIPLLIASFFICGKKYTFRTLYAVIIFSFVIDAFEFAVSFRYTADPLLSTLYGGILTGLGLYTVMSRSLVTGGSDLLALLIQRLRPGKTIGTLVLIIDGFVVLAGALVYKSLETALYSMALIIIMTLVLDNMLHGRTQGDIHFIFTSEPETVKRRIKDELDRGFSVINVYGGYTGDSKELILCAVSLRESVLLRRLVFESDERAFIIIADANRVCGNGFTKEEMF